MGGKTMTPLTIALPPDVFALVRAGKKRMIATRRNPRKDRYFAAKTPTEAKINGTLYQITRIEGTPEEWRVHIAPTPDKCKHPSARLYAWSGKDALGAFTAVVCCLCGSVLHC
ncbi:MAG: hypothetical protein WC455_26115 [Dehalococcoidia bacterium]